MGNWRVYENTGDAYRNVGKTPRRWFGDVSLWLLLFSNLITVFWATREGWELPVLMWIYWWQSIIIGVFNFVRILKLKEFSTTGFRINGRPAEPTSGTKIYAAFFFLIHYGAFHLGYLIFLAAEYGKEVWVGSTGLILSAALLFFINHFFSFVYNRPHDTKKQNIGTLMFYPYARIIPMHIIIAAGPSLSSSPLVVFLLLKTLADAVMHILEHWVIRKGEARE